MIRSIAVVIIACAGAAVPDIVKAQESPVGKETWQPVAYVRCWIFPGKESDDLTVIAKGVDKTEHQLGSAQGVAVSPTGYAALPPGAYSLEVKSGSKTASSAPCQFKDGEYYTLAVVPKGAAWGISSYFDGPLADKGAPRAVRVFSFSSGRNTLLYFGEAKPTQLASGTVAELKMLPALTPLRVEVLAADGGAPAISTVELDLKRWPSGYVVVSADYRGRMRPRVLRGGEEKEPEAP